MNEPNRNCGGGDDDFTGGIDDLIARIRHEGARAARCAPHPGPLMPHSALPYGIYRSGRAVARWKSKTDPRRDDAGAKPPDAEHSSVFAPLGRLKARECSVVQVLEGVPFGHLEEDPTRISNDDRSDLEETHSQCRHFSGRQLGILERFTS